MENRKAELLARWRAKSVRRVTLPSGTKAVVQLVDVPVMLRAGAFPDEVKGMARVFQTKGVDLEGADDKTLLEWDLVQAAIIAKMIRELEGVPVELTPEDVGFGDHPKIPLTDRDQLWAWQMRLARLPAEEEEAELDQAAPAPKD